MVIVEFLIASSTVLIIVLILTQVVIPIVQGRRQWPLFRRSRIRKLEAQLAETKDEVLAQRIQEEIDVLSQ